MKIVQTEKTGIVCITFNGSMNGLLTSEAERTIRQTLKENKNQIVFDLGALEYLRSTVLGMILDIVKEMKHKNGQVVLCNLNKYVKEIFEVSGDGIYLQIADSVESGVAALS